MTTVQKKEFHCDKCNYTYIYESHWKQHTSSKKHQNIDRQPRSIPKEHYRNIIKGAYERDAKPLEKESRARPLKNYL